MSPSHPVSGGRGGGILRVLRYPFFGTRCTTPDTTSPTNTLLIPRDSPAGPHGRNMPLGFLPSRTSLESSNRSARGFLHRDFLLR
ncbi:hypothetical protein C7212DRAFT_322915 [Tuber magnatum]|uniref:Uncharacterized protein n=1 Tax=Tuber magnatum TaxID=42249 RepID=A0A317SNV8_9PEZI|nr:hypothetical protein C7212DRAFT_322915 [Tuber magnatum]